MKKIFKSLGIGLLCFIGLLIFLSTWIDSQIPEDMKKVNPTPIPAISDEEISDLAKRYYDSHIQMNWAEDQFYGGNLTQESSRKLIKQCFETFLDKDRCESVVNEKFWIGMPKLWALLSLGRPDDKNITTTSTLNREQWIYGNPIYGATYLYFDNDILTSFQN